MGFLHTVLRCCGYNGLNAGRLVDLHGLLGIGDENEFDLGGIIAAIVGAVIAPGMVTWIVNRTRK